MAGREATAKAAAWANWLLDPTTKFEKLYLGLREDKAGGKESWLGSITGVSWLSFSCPIWAVFSASMQKSTRIGFSVTDFKVVSIKSR